MSTESLINNIDFNIDYNIKMDKNLSILSNEGTILPEDLSYSINIIDPQPSYSKIQEDKIKLLENKLLRMKYILILKIIILIMLLLGIICILYL